MALPYVAVERCGDDVVLAQVLTASDLFERATGWCEPLLPVPRTRRLGYGGGVENSYPIGMPVQTAPTGFTVGWDGRSVVGTLADDTTVRVSAGFGQAEQLAPPSVAMTTTSTALSIAEVGVVYRIGSEIVYGVPTQTVTRGVSGEVVRAQAGTTAATHSTSTAVYRLDPPPVLASAAIRAAGLVQQGEALVAEDGFTPADDYVKALIALFDQPFRAGLIHPQPLESSRWTS